MKNILQIILCSFIFIGSALAEDAIVAVVNDKVITRYQLDNRAKLIIDTQNITFQDSAQKEQFDRQLAEKMAEEIMLRDATSHMQFDISDEVINDTINVIEQRNGMRAGEMLVFLREKGISVQTYKDQIASEVLKNYIYNTVFAEVDVAPSELESELFDRKMVPKIEVVTFTSKDCGCMVETYKKTSRLHQYLKKKDKNKSFDNDKFITNLADIEYIDDYTKLMPYSKSVLADLRPGELSGIYQDDSKYRIMLLKSKRFDLDDEQLAKIQLELKERKAMKKYNLFVANIRNKANIKINI